MFQGVAVVPGDYGVYSVSGSTTFKTGPYAGSYLWNDIDYIPQRSSIVEVRVDTIDGYASPSFVHVIEAAMEAPGGPTLSTGAHSVNPSTITATLTHAPYDSAQIQGLSAAGSLPAYANCPEVVFSGVTYTLAPENELLNATAEGLVVTATKGGGTITIPWGSQVKVIADTFATPSSETWAFCKVPPNTEAHYVNFEEISTP